MHILLGPWVAWAKCLWNSPNLSDALESVIRDAVNYTEHAKRKTITPKAVYLCSEGTSLVPLWICGLNAHWWYRNFSCVYIVEGYVITPVTATVSTYLPWPPCAERHKLKWSYLCCVAQGGQGKYNQVSLLPTGLLTNIANVNDPLLIQPISYLYPMLLFRNIIWYDSR